MSRTHFIANASSAGKLMVGGTGFTDADAALLKEYEQRKAGTYLTPSGRKSGPIKGMDEKMAALIEKRKAGFQFGATSLTYIEERWRYDRYGFLEPVVTNVLLKGQMCEQDTMELAQEQIPSKGFRFKCKRRITTDLYTGQCDVDLEPDDLIEDEKTCWSLKTFFEVTEAPSDYYTQGQVYMKLYGRSKFRLVYGLVDTPDYLIERELRKYRYMFSPDGDTDNRHYKEIEEQVYHNHKVEHRIPAHDRIKFFEFDRDDEFLAKLDRRVRLADEIYQTLTLGGMGKNPKELSAAKAA